MIKSFMKKYQKYILLGFVLALCSLLSRLYFEQLDSMDYIVSSTITAACFGGSLGAFFESYMLYSGKREKKK